MKTIVLFVLLNVCCSTVAIAAENLSEINNIPVGGIFVSDSMATADNTDGGGTSKAQSAALAVGRITG